jgi:hypothetical protein
MQEAGRSARTLRACVFLGLVLLGFSRWGGAGGPSDPAPGKELTEEEELAAKLRKLLVDPSPSPIPDLRTPPGKTLSPERRQESMLDKSRQQASEAAPDTASIPATAGGTGGGRRRELVVPVGKRLPPGASRPIKAVDPAPKVRLASGSIPATDEKEEKASSGAFYGWSPASAAGPEPSPSVTTSPFPSLPVVDASAARPSPGPSPPARKKGVPGIGLALFFAVAAFIGYRLVKQHRPG